MLVVLRKMENHNSIIGIECLSHIVGPEGPGRRPRSLNETFRPRDIAYGPDGNGALVRSHPEMWGARWAGGGGLRRDKRRALEFQTLGRPRWLSFHPPPLPMSRTFQDGYAQEHHYRGGPERRRWIPKVFVTEIAARELYQACTGSSDTVYSLAQLNK